ncbi:Uncharacterised protein [Vibrio cholerae]|nr:Uncharacterised protein [Vibrio cholerae]CSI68159.1 Uncharacterised protein [Vibrio cholerae]
MPKRHTIWPSLISNVSLALLSISSIVNNFLIVQFNAWA